jgi:LTXXQ motif family protein
MTKKALLIGTVAAAAVLVAGWAVAQPYGRGFGPSFMWGDGPGMGPGMMRDWGRGMGPMHRWGGGPMMMGGIFADPARIETLKSELGITAAQEPAWTKYAKALEEAATAMRATRASVDPSAVSRMSDQDRYALFTKVREDRQKQFGTVNKAADDLLATLDDGQKAKARATLPGLGFGPGPMWGGSMGGPHHWGR